MKKIKNTLLLASILLSGCQILEPAYDPQLVAGGDRARPEYVVSVENENSYSGDIVLDVKGKTNFVGDPATHYLVHLRFDPSRYDQPFEQELTHSGSTVSRGVLALVTTDEPDVNGRCYTPVKQVRQWNGNVRNLVEMMGNPSNTIEEVRLPYTATAFSMERVAVTVASLRINRNGDVAHGVPKNLYFEFDHEEVESLSYRGITNVEIGYHGNCILIERNP